MESSSRPEAQNRVSGAVQPIPAGGLEAAKASVSVDTSKTSYLACSNSNMNNRRKPYDYSKPRPNYPRSKTGCLSCRARKKKCDEAKPRCAACRRNQLACHWPEVPQQSDHHSVSGSDSSEPGPNSPGQRRSLASVDSQPAAPSSTPRRLPSPSPGRQLWKPQTACSLTQASALLLRHYLEYTSGLLSSAPLSKCPFVIIVLPLAYTDDLLMHTVLALSGTHLACRQSRKVVGPIGNNSTEIQHATTLHYHQVISGLRRELADFETADGQKQVRLLLILILVCHYEAISGNETGIILQHLRASRELIGRTLSQPRGHNIDHESLGFSLELYAYLSIVNSFVSNGTIGRAIQPYDKFLTSLDALRGYSTFGTMFGGCHALFELIPQVSQLGAECLIEERLVQGPWSPSRKLQDSYQRLEKRISEWIFLPQPGESLAEVEETAKVGEAIRHSLYVYLLAAIGGLGRPGRAEQATIDSHTNIVMSLSISIVESKSKTLLLWPVIMAGSCIIDKDQQETLIYGIQNSGFDMKHLFKLCELLQYLWDDEDPRAYGPFGLYLMMEKHNMYIPIL